MPHFGEPRRQIFVPYNGKIADITHADVIRHTLDLEAALPETRKIIGVILKIARVAGTGAFMTYPNEGVEDCILHEGEIAAFIIIADGTQRLDYRLTVANDDWDLYCFGYVVEI